MKNIYSVAQVNLYIKRMIAEDFLLSDIKVRGEISNCKYHSSGHIYFTLKDDKGTLSCIMFAGNSRNLTFRLEEGQKVVIHGSVDVYERDGKYQLYAKSVEKEGAGELYEKFLLLKQEMADRGMFAQEYKKSIPRYIKTLGVVTAPTGAAIQDIINISTRRNPSIQIVLYPALVQGASAAPSIVRGIQTLESYGVDVMIVGRGGGSIEDLWAFNEEIVAQAIFDCNVPIISAVGHETDTTIADYVADLRAPTPSAAAELAVYELDRLYDELKFYRDRFYQSIQDRLMDRRNQVKSYTLMLSANSPENRIRQKRTELLHLEEKLPLAMSKVLLGKRHQLEMLIEKMKGYSPLDKLNQGFAYVTDSQKNSLKTIEQVEIDDRIKVFLKNGDIVARVEKINNGYDYSGDHT